MKHMGYHDAVDNTLYDATSGWLDRKYSEVTSSMQLVSAYMAKSGRMVGADVNCPKPEIKKKTANHETTRISAGG